MPKQILKNNWGLATLLFLFSIAGVSSATADQTYGVPTGTLTVTTFEAPLLQTRNTKSYTVSSDASYAPGVKKDPHGAVGINRSFQQRYANNVYGAIIPIPITFITVHSDIPITVPPMQSLAVELLTKLFLH